uniref:Uncharacterized protein n=1 Tax=Sphaerodactylus townsendi TaxID=933632 RepID=A0ACB8FP37_9SAUR
MDDQEGPESPELAGLILGSPNLVGRLPGTTSPYSMGPRGKGTQASPSPGPQEALIVKEVERNQAQALASGEISWVGPKGSLGEGRAWEEEAAHKNMEGRCIG